MKKVLFLLFFLATSLVSMAQSHLTDVVYLKNGSVIRGIIIEQDPARSLRIQTRDGSVFVYQMIEIDRIAKEAPAPSYTAYDTYMSHFKPRFEGYLDAGITTDELRVDILASAGARINPYLYLGAGVGANYLTDSELFFIPIFAHGRLSYPVAPNINGFVDFRLGYSATAEEGYEGGFYMSGLSGLEFGRVSFGVGFTRNKYKMPNILGVTNLIGVTDGYFSNVMNGFTARLAFRF
ncbi:MAG: hypothetical protein HUK09_07115 [Bacteroidaceae bacterium]|nr:hypothetical protein [Bacteroidaceae bacterium]